jgi:hypothetical protein
LGIFQKTSNNSRSVFNVTKLFIGINAEIMKLSADMLLVTIRFLKRYLKITQWVSKGYPCFNGWMMGAPMQSSAVKAIKASTSAE